MTIQVLRERGVSNRAIGRPLGVDERTVRHRLQRVGEERPDGRSGRVFRVEAMAGVIARFMEDAQSRDRGLDLQFLYERLVGDYGYTGSYESVQRCVRAHYPQPKLRTRRRVETPPGAQGQVDWAEFPRVRIGGETIPLHDFHLVVSHSRMEAVAWSARADSLAWLPTCTTKRQASAGSSRGAVRRQGQDGRRQGGRASGSDQRERPAVQTLLVAVVSLGLGGPAGRSDTLRSVLARNVAAVDRLDVAAWLEGL